MVMGREKAVGQWLLCPLKVRRWVMGGSLDALLTHLQAGIAKVAIRTATSEPQFI